MASHARRKKTSPRSASSFFDVLPKLLNAFLLLGAVFNFLFLAWSASHTVPRTVHTVESFVTNHFFSVTQTVERVFSSASSAASVESVSLEVPVSYHFMVVDGVPMFRYFGQNFKCGDFTSYGRIEAIFPDRVRLEGSVFLKNSKNPDIGAVPNE